MSYAGAKNTTFDGVECIPWDDAFSRCTKGYEDDLLKHYLSQTLAPAPALMAAAIMLPMTPDRMGLRGIRGESPSSGPFDVVGDSNRTGAQGGGNNECRFMPEHSFRVFSDSMRNQVADRVSEKYLLELFPPRSLGEGRPFCFVNASDPRVKAFSAKTGGTFDLCAEVQLMPCGVKRCEVDTAPGLYAPVSLCARAPAAEASTSGGETRAKLLLANGGFELWARRTNANGMIRDVTITMNNPSALAWADVTYRKYPTFETGYPAGANPAEPRFWDLCFYNRADLKRMGVGHSASGYSGARVEHALHTLGSLVQCDPVIPRVQGVSLERHAPGRDGGSSVAARLAFVKANDTAALKSENGAVASIAPGVLHVARAWVRCVNGDATVALVVSSLPDAARLSDEKDREVSVEHYDAFANVTVGGDGPKNVLRCTRVDPSDNATASSWTQLEVGVTSSRPRHEVSVQLVAHSLSEDVVILVDDASLEAVTADAPPMTGAGALVSPEKSAVSSALTRCTGGGGAGVSYSDSHRCSMDPTRLFYRLREKGGVPVAVEQVHAMVTLGYMSIKCRRPEMDPASTAECPHLSRATLPHLSALDVKTELVQHMGWSDANARGPGVDADASVALGILREGLPEAIEKGVVRVVDGPDYNTALSNNRNPPIGGAPALVITWQAMASTTSFKVADVLGRGMPKVCGHQVNRRKAVCYAWAEVRRMLGCGIVPLLLQQPAWKELVTFDGHLGSLRSKYYDAAIPFGNQDPSHPHRIDMGTLPSSISSSVLKYFSDAEIEDGVLCYSSIANLMRTMGDLPAELLASPTLPRMGCGEPLDLAWLDSLRRLLPLSAPEGKKCVDLSALNYDDAEELFEHHEESIVNSVGVGVGVNHLGKENEEKSSTLVFVLFVTAAAAAVFFAAVGFFRFAVVSGYNLPRLGRRARRREGEGGELVDTRRQEMFSKCRYVQFIGKGYEAEVYLGEIVDAGTIQQFASKMYFRHNQAKAELDLYERLPSHENILKVFGFYIDKQSKRRCLAMEYCRHGDVRSCMTTGKFPRSRGFAHRVVAGVIGALNAMHEGAMAHRDVKLDNVLLCCPCAATSTCDCLLLRSRDVSAKLADFGMSKGGELMNISSGNVRGTVAYIPPERISYKPAEHHKDFYALGDIYSLGLFIWEVLHFVHHGTSVGIVQATLPERAHSHQDILVSISSGTLIPPCDFLTHAAREFLSTCWHHDPARRYRSMELVMREWENLSDDAMLVGAATPPAEPPSDG